MAGWNVSTARQPLRTAEKQGVHLSKNLNITEPNQSYTINGDSLIIQHLPKVNGVGLPRVVRLNPTTRVNHVVNYSLFTDYIFVIPGIGCG
jgi:hypothetical protein